MRAARDFRHLDRQLQMLRRQTVDQRRRLVQVAHDDHRAMLAPARLGDASARQGLQMVREGRQHRVGKTGIIGDQDRLRGGVVLGLGQEIGGDQAGSLRLSATTRISEGPAMVSMPTTPKTRRLAAAT